MVFPDPTERIVRAGAASPRVSIADMGAWFFWASPRALGLSADDVDAIMGGTANDDQFSRMQARANAARLNLIEAEVNEIMRKPS